MFPASLEVPEIIKAGRSYLLNPSAEVNHIRFYNKTDEELTVEMSITNVLNQEEMFDKSHIRISPEKFTIPARGSQEITVRLKVPQKECVAGNYHSVIQAKPIIQNEGPNGVIISTALGVRVYYSVDCSRDWQWIIWNWIRSWQNRALASANEVQNNFPWLVVLSGLIIFLLTASTLVNKIRFRGVPKELLSFEDFNNLNNRQSKLYLKRIGKNSAMMKEIFKEIDKALGGRIPTKKELKLIPRTIRKAYLKHAETSFL